MTTNLVVIDSTSMNFSVSNIEDPHIMLLDSNFYRIPNKHQKYVETILLDDELCYIDGQRGGEGRGGGRELTPQPWGGGRKLE